MAALLLLAACSEVGSSDVSPEARAVVFETEGCDLASGRIGSGVAIEDDLVITVAHLVVRAANLEASISGRTAVGAEVVAVDLQRDLALVRLEGEHFEPVRTVVARPGSTGMVVGGARSGSVPYEVVTFADLRIEEILGEARHTRHGYELRAVTADGDSGAGVYDEEGRLVGIVFGRGPAEETTWITAVSEIFDFIEGADLEGSYVACD